MKIKSFFAIMIIAILAILSGCSENTNAKSANNANSINNAETEDFDKMREELLAEHKQFVYIDIDESTNCKDAVKDAIDKSKKIKEDDSDYRAYSDSKVSEISKFYHLDNLKIDDYKLSLVVISPTVFSFDFYPKNPKEEDLYGDEYRFSVVSGISIMIDRFETIENVEKVFEDIVKESIEMEYGYLNEDNMLYEDLETYLAVYSIFDDTIVRITVPKERGCEYLRDIAFRVIKTAELIDIDETKIN